MARTAEVSGSRSGEHAPVGAGWILFASIVMIMGGFFAIFEGLAALLRHGSLAR